MMQAEGFACSRSATSRMPLRRFHRRLLTKKPGVCLTVSAPGFLNGLTRWPRTTNCFPDDPDFGSSEREIVDLQQGDYEK